MISVFDKSGIAELCKCFIAHGISIYATGKTFDYLKSQGIETRPLSDITGFSELVSGQVKTLHPAVFASILAVRANSEHMAELRSLGVPRFDIIVSNLYPFEQKLSEGAQDATEMRDLIDIGGVSLTRAAAKNFADVAVITDVAQYGGLMRELETGRGELSAAYMRSLAAAAFERTAAYDSYIASYLRGENALFGENLFIRARKKMDLRYGENPFQKAAVYRSHENHGVSVLDADVFDGKELSFNNILDLNIALEMASSFRSPTAIIVKHANPSGVAESADLSDALHAAYESDARSAYGCVIGLNTKVDLRSAQFLSKKFVDAIIAPAYEIDALDILRKKKKLRILELRDMYAPPAARELDIRHIAGGYLTQTTAVPELKKGELKTVTRRGATDEELDSLLFGWKVVRFLWSNAIVLSKGRRTTGIGAGQSSRVDAVRIAIEKSGGASAGSVMASDAFFPFRDGIDEAAKGGVTAVLQPGGSIRDDEVIAAADEHGMAMLFTGQRLFRH